MSLPSRDRTVNEQRHREFTDQGHSTATMAIPQRVKELLSRLLRIVISVGLIVVVIWSIDMVELRSALSQVTLATLLVMCAIDILLRLLSAYRWHVLFSGLHDGASLRETTEVSLVASFLGQAMPGTIGVEALRIYGLGKRNNDIPAAIASVVADRVFGFLSLVLVIMIGLAISPTELGEVVLAPVSVSLVAAAIVIVLLISPRHRNWIRRHIPKRVFDYIPDAIPKVFQNFESYKTKTHTLLYSSVLATSFQVLRVTLFFVGAIMLGESPDFVLFLALVPIVMFVALLPISIGGLGVREASLVALFGQFGVMDAAQAFILSILVFVSGIISILPGGLIYVAQREQFGSAMKKPPEQEKAL